MKSIYICFRIMLEQMFHDFMLTAIFIIPIFSGILLKIGTPLLELYLTSTFSLSQVLTPYYSLIDCAILAVTPIMFNFTTALVMVEERDDHIISYISVTPLTKNGYLFARLGFMNILSFCISMLLSMSCSLIGFSFLDLLFIAVLFTMLGILITLLIITLSSNKMEGMAIGKLTGLLTIGLIIPYVMHSPIQYIFICMPTYWLSMFILQENYIFLLSAFIVIMIELVFLYKQFLKRIS